MADFVPRKRHGGIIANFLAYGIVCGVLGLLPPLGDQFAIDRLDCCCLCRNLTGLAFNWRGFL